MGDNFLNVEYNLKEKKIYYKSFIEGNYVVIKISHNHMFSIDGFVDGDIRTRLGISPKKTFKLVNILKNINVVSDIYIDIDNCFDSFIKDENKIKKDIKSLKDIQVYHEGEEVDDFKIEIQRDKYQTDTIQLRNDIYIEYYYREYERIDIYRANNRMSKVYNIWTNGKYLIINDRESQILYVLTADGTDYILDIEYSKTPLIDYNSYAINTITNHKNKYRIEYKYDNRGILRDIKTDNDTLKSRFKRTNAVSSDSSSVVIVEYPMIVHKIFGDFIVDDKTIMQDTIYMDKNGIIETIVKTIND